ncbi:MAG: ATP-binding cassette domain-containing protein [Acidimicrobiales bacterium]|nr:ATP-binding cassette domain-containing protein [Acidimicrobiales bacterium]
MSNLAIETRHIFKHFGKNEVVKDVSLNVPAGVAFGYLGPNGAGKTTLIRMLLGLTKASSGQMEILGYNVPKDSAKALERVGAIVDEPRFFPHLRAHRRTIRAISGVACYS